MIQKVDLPGSQRLAVMLDVTASGNKIQIAGGKFKVAGVEYTLTPQEITLSLPPPDLLSVQAFLACDKDSSTPFLMVDEAHRVNGAFDHYTWVESGPKPLNRLLVVNLTPANSSLDEATVKVFLRTPPPPKEAANG